MAKSKLPPQIARLLAVSKEHRHGQGGHHHGHEHTADDSGGDAEIFEPGCSIRALPGRLQADAAGVAAAINPVNMPQAFMELAVAVPDQPQFLTLTVGKYWGPQPRTLTVSFMEATPADLRDRILSHMNAWNNCCGVRFRFTNGTGQVRISRTGAGYWSYLGTDILLIPQNRPTMNLQNFSMATPESEYRRVVRHETGHTLGFPHEHMRRELVARIDREKAYAYFAQTQGWSRAQVDAQVLTPLNDASIMGTPPDQTSIMCYRLPGSIMKNGQPIVGGTDINGTDCAFARSIYPRPVAPFAMSEPASEAAGTVAALADWSEEEDVDVSSLLASLRNGNAEQDELEPAD